MSIQKALELDKQLMSKNILDGSKVIYRRSPFNAQRDHLILDLKNKFIGSGRWIRDRLIRMDTQRHNIIGESLANNYVLRHKRDDDRIHNEIADMVSGGGDTFIN